MTPKNAPPELKGDMLDTIYEEAEEHLQTGTTLVCKWEAVTAVRPKRRRKEGSENTPLMNANSNPNITAPPDATTARRARDQL
jgi:hypothetical protein